MKVHRDQTCKSVLHTVTNGSCDEAFSRYLNSTAEMLGERPYAIALIHALLFRQFLNEHLKTLTE